MALNLSIKVDGEEVLKRSFRKVIESVSDLTLIAADVQDEFFLIGEEQFQSGGAKGAHGKWAELSPRYEEIKVRELGTFALLAGALVRSERLYKSLSRKTDDTIFEASKSEITLGTRVPYATIHQRGTRRMPACRPVDPSDAQKKRLGNRIKKGLLPIVRRESGLVMDESNFADFG